MSNVEEKDLAQTIVMLMNEESASDPMLKFALSVLRTCVADGYGHWLPDPGAATVPIPAALRARFPKQVTMQPRRILLEWARPELIGEYVTMTCGEKSCVRPSHCAGTGREFKLPAKPRSRRRTMHGRNDAKAAARETLAFLDVAHHVGPEHALVLVRAAQTLSALGIDPTELLMTSGD